MSDYKNVMLISENTIKESLAIDKNLSYGYIAPVIRVAQDIRLQRVLGTSLYDAIRKAVVDDPTLTEIGNAQFKILLDDYIKNCLLYSVLAELQSVVTFKTRNLGVVNNNDLGSVNATLSEINFLQEKYTNYAKFYEEQLTDHLCHNKTLYPDYKYVDEGIDPTRKNYTCPIKL